MAVEPGPGPARQGESHAEASILVMLEEAIRDHLAMADEPCRALVIGCGSDVVRRLLACGLESVVVVDSPPAAQAEAIPGDGEGTDIAFVACGVARREEAIDLAQHSGVALCAIDSRDRLADLQRARNAGFATVSLAPVPADSERSVVLLDRALLLARSPQR
jgi:hypothetical protein